MAVTRDAPSIDVIQYDISPIFTMLVYEIPAYPLHQMILEYALDNLM